MDIYVVFDDVKQIERLENNPTFHCLDILSKKDMKKAKALKSHWAARKNPFAVAIEDDKVIKAFYTESGEDIIESILKFVNE